MPRNLRDLAENFLLSQEKDFKVGLFNAKKKTQEEQNLRLEQFLSALNQTVETTIQWKLREKNNFFCCSRSIRSLKKVYWRRSKTCSVLSLMKMYLPIYYKEHVLTSIIF